MKIRLLQCYEILWIHNIDAICKLSLPAWNIDYSDFYLRRRFGYYCHMDQHWYYTDPGNCYYCSQTSDCCCCYSSGLGYFDYSCCPGLDYCCYLSPSYHYQRTCCRTPHYSHNRPRSRYRHRPLLHSLHPGLHPGLRPHCPLLHNLGTAEAVVAGKNKRDFKKFAYSAQYVLFL